MWSDLPWLFGLGTLVVVFNNHVLQPRRQAKYCQSNLKQMGLAFMQYARDYDESFPLAHNWADALWPYSKSKAIFECRTRRDLSAAYAMNSRAAGLTLVEMYAPAESVLAFESDAGRFNAVDGGTSLPKVARHPQGHHILFGDGHVKATPQPDFTHGYDVVKAKALLEKSREAFRIKHSGVDLNSARLKNPNTPKPTR